VTPRRILLVLNHAGYFGVFQALASELVRRGHSVHVAFLSGTAADRELPPTRG
jgi:hypothetical protein